MPESGLTVKDLVGLSEPACKLIDAIRATTGVLFEPTRIRRKAKAEADATILEVKTTLETQELERRASERVKAREIRRQANLDEIVDGATRHLPPNSETRGALTEDWVCEFMNHCQDISDELMQSVWSRMLAGEFVSPGKYSFRTLNFVKLLSKADADIFSRFCSYLWFTGSDIAYLKTKKTDELLASAGLPHISLLHLQSVGLISMEMGLRIKLNGHQVVMQHRDQHYIFSFPSDTTDPGISCVLLTNMGKELKSLCLAEPSPNYLSTLAESLMTESKCRVTLLNIIDGK